MRRLREAGVSGVLTYSDEDCRLHAVSLPELRAGAGAVLCDVPPGHVDPWRHVQSTATSSGRDSATASPMSFSRERRSRVPFGSASGFHRSTRMSSSRRCGRRDWSAAATSRWRTPSDEPSGCSRASRAARGLRPPRLVGRRRARDPPELDGPLLRASGPRAAAVHERRPRGGHARRGAAGPRRGLVARRPLDRAGNGDERLHLPSEEARDLVVRIPLAVHDLDWASAEDS